MATTNIQSFAGDVEVSGELTVTGQLNSTTGSDKVKLTATTASETDFIPLSKGTTGAQALYTDSNLTYNPANNAIGANITGSAAFATSATHANAANAVRFDDRDGANNTDFIAFVDGHAAGDKALFTDQNLTYNSSTGQIGANISGNAAFATNATYANSAGSATNATFANAATNATFATSATHANNANTVAFTDRDTNNETDYIAFVANHTAGDKALYTDSNLTYNPANNHINANVPYANNAGTLGGVAASTGANGNSIAHRDGSGHLTMAYGFSTYLNMSHGVGTRNSDSVFYSSTDSYIRKNNATGMRSSLNVPTRTGGNASGTWSINVNGSAGSAANATYAAQAGYVSGGVCKYNLKYVTTQRLYPSNTMVHIYDMDFNYAAERSNSTLVIQYSMFYEVHWDRVFQTYVNNSYYPYQMGNIRYGVAATNYDTQLSDTPHTFMFTVHYAPGTTANRTYKLYSRSSTNQAQNFALNRALNTGPQHSEFGISYALCQEFAA